MRHFRSVLVVLLSAAAASFISISCKEKLGEEQAGLAKASGENAASGVEGRAAAARARHPGRPYALTVRPPDPTPSGALAQATVTLEPKGEYKVNLEYPLRLTVSRASGGAPLELRAKDAKELSEQRLVLQPAVALQGAGEQRFSGQLRFSVCTKAQCELYTENLSWVAKVQ